MSRRARTLMTLGLVCSAAGLALRPGFAEEAPPVVPPIAAPVARPAAAPQITVTAVTTDGTPVRGGVVALELGDGPDRFVALTTLTLNANGKQSFARPSAGTFRARLVDGGDFVATVPANDRLSSSVCVCSPPARVTEADPGPDLRIVAPIAGCLRVHVPAAVTGGTFVLRRPSPPYALAPLRDPMNHVGDSVDVPPRPGTDVRWRGVLPGRWHVLLRSRNTVAVAAETDVRAGKTSEVALPDPAVDGGPTGRDVPTLECVGLERHGTLRLDRWDDPRCPDSARWSRGAGGTSKPTSGLRAGAYVLSIGGLDDAMIVRHDGTSRTVRVAPPPPPPPGGVTVRVRVQADGLDVDRVFVGLLKGDTTLPDGTWLRSARGQAFDHVPPGRHTLVVLDGVDLYVVGIPGGVHMQPLDVRTADVTATVALR